MLNTCRLFLIFSLVFILVGCASRPLSAKQLSLTPCFKSNQPLEKTDNSFPIQNFAINAKYKF